MKFGWLVEFVAKFCWNVVKHVFFMNNFICYTDTILNTFSKLQVHLARLEKHYCIKYNQFNQKTLKIRRVCETRMPPPATKSKYGKNFEVLYFDLPHPQGHVMSVKCEEPIDKFTVQVW